MNIKEISKRSVFHTDDYGISGIDSVNAEIVVEDDGKNIYMLAQWVSEVADTICFETTFESTYNLYEKMFDSECDFEEVCKERDRLVNAGISDKEAEEKYPKQREALIEMVKEKLLENGIVFGEEDDEDEE